MIEKELDIQETLLENDDIELLNYLAQLEDEFNFNQGEK